jgi:hypothetical protein
MAVAGMQALPYPLQPPYYTIRADAWQARVMEAARNYFSPAEMADLQRIGIKFVPQEADRIKRHLRRRGDYVDAGLEPQTLRGKEEGPVGPTGDPANTVHKLVDLANATSPNIGAEGQMAPLNAAGIYENGNPPNGVARNWRAVGFGASPNWYRTPNKDSLLRRTQLFIGSVFLFDLAHALLRHLRQEVLSLVANGSEADDALLKQVTRNVRGMTFVELVPEFQADGVTDNVYNAVNNPKGWDPAQIRNRAQATIKIPKSIGNPDSKTYLPRKVEKYSEFHDIYRPLSITELETLRSRGYVSDQDKYYTPRRLPEWLGGLLGGDFKNSGLYVTDNSRLTALRNQGVYPATYLTNGVVADDCSAARLIEHCNAKTITPEFFTWEMRKAVFIPLELVVLDITRLEDISAFDKLSQVVNSFGTGMYQGTNITNAFTYLNKFYQKLSRDVARSMLEPFVNVTKAIQLPATASQPRRSFANEEVMRLFVAADDILTMIDTWNRTAGNLNEVTFEDYLNPDRNLADYHKNVMGNKPAAQNYGETNFGMSPCGEGTQTIWYNADPHTNPRAQQVPRYLPTGAINPQALVSVCLPVMPGVRPLPDMAAAAINPDQQYVAVAAQAKRRRTKSSKKKKAHRAK